MTVKCKCFILCILAPVRITSTLFTIFYENPVFHTIFNRFPESHIFVFKIHTLKRIISVKQPINNLNVRCRLALSIDILSLRVF